MFNFAFRQTLLATVGAFVLTITMVAAAVAPARLAETSPVVYADTAASAEGAANA